MTPRDRILRRGAALLIVLHAAGALAAPGLLWGVSQLAAWGPVVTIVWTTIGLAALVLVPIRAHGRRALAFPNRRASAVIALLATVAFTLLRERGHFFGDGALLIRDRGWSESASRAPLLVRVTVQWIRWAAHAGWAAETAFAMLSILSGTIAVYAILRLATTLTTDRGGRFLAASLLLSAGAMQLFCGHAEYYALPAALILVYLASACRALTGAHSSWPTWWIYATLVPMHLQTLALGPAQLYLGWREWRAHGWRRVLPHVVAAIVLVPVLARLAGASAGALGRTTLAGLGRYVSPYFETASAKHDFGLLSPGHFLAILNDTLLTAPLVLVALPALWTLRRIPRQPVHAFLGVASAGAFVFSFMFHRELGPYRDWDILAVNGFVGLAWVAAHFVRPHPGSQRTAIAIVLIAAGHHMLPWVLMQTSTTRTLTHLQQTLEHRGQWSPHAAGYMWEEIAIYHRTHRDEAASFTAYENAVHANPSDARYRVGYANRLFLRNELEAAEREYRLALQKRPRLAPALNNLAIVIVRRKGDLEEARRHAQLAVELEPANAEFWATLAGVELQAGRPGAAREAVEKALGLRPDLASARKLQTLLAAPSPVPANGLLEPPAPEP